MARKVFSLHSYINYVEQQKHKQEIKKNDLDIRTEEEEEENKIEEDQEEEEDDDELSHKKTKRVHAPDDKDSIFTKIGFVGRSVFLNFKSRT
jgi:hypothetical protein